MCGICGFNWDDKDLVSKMNDAIMHRGPDQDGIYTADGISLGHRRLSIIDLSEQGRQPMQNEDGNIQLAFNGEIYNYEDLKPELERKGHKFASNTDSEVIIHAYEEYGTDCVNKLRGMFAFAIWDRPKQQLFIARDRIGIKPLYYYNQNGKFIFGSEIKSILQNGDVSRELNHQAFYDYIGLEFVPAPVTMFRNIMKLPAGHHLVCKNGNIKITQYWDLSLKPNAENISYNDAVEKQRDILDYAVKSHLMSDVPLGVFLSGGLDSSALVAMMRRHISGKLQTFTIGYKDKSFGELDFAKQVADYFDTDHQVVMIEDQLTPDHVEKALYHLDEPMTDLSSVPLFMLCEQVKKHVTVCLSGEGGDESYAGYDRFKASRLNRYFSAIPSPLRKHIISPLVARLPDQPQKKGAINMLKRFIEGSNLPKEGQHLRWQYFSNANQNAALFNDNLKSKAEFDTFRLIRPYLEKCDAEDIVNREIYLDMRYQMPDSVLMKVDKMSMASSLEVRVPLLDHVLVEFIASLPGNWKLKGMDTKHVFRSALDGMLPDNIVHRGKQGYSLPVKNLLRGEMKQYMIDLFDQSEIIKKNINTKTLNRLIEEHSNMKHNHNHVLWALINTAIWQQKFDVKC